MEVANDLFSLEARLCFVTSVGHGRVEAGPFKKSLGSGTIRVSIFSKRADIFPQNSPYFLEFCGHRQTGI